MANYQYDESGVLASYFALTFLTLILIPLTFSFLPSRQEPTLKNVCNCSECEAKEARMKRSKSRSIFKPRLGVKSLSTIGGWALFAFLCYKIATTEVNSKPYDPFEILGLGHGTAEKEIKRHYKKLSLKFHPDKVKLAENQTMEEVEAHFVELTKAYKSLTDEEIRNNLEKYGHPDGKQEFSMGLALPTWVVESKNNFWVLGAYGLLFAGLLPMLVGRWWFGSRKMTKDGVLGATAQLFFKNVREDSSPETLIYLLARAWDIEQGSTFNSAASEPALAKLEAAVKEIVGDSYGKTAKIPTTQGTVATRRALALLYAHLLRIQIQDSSLQQELDLLLPATQTYLGSMVSMALAHNWLACTSSIMHLHSYIVQATFPGSNPLLAYPSVTKDEAKLGDGGVVSYIKALEDKHDPRAEIIQRVADKWGHLQVIDPQFKVIGERIVTPGAIVQLVFKLRLTPPTQAPTEPATELTPEQRKQEIREEDAFLTGKEDTAALLPGLQVPGYVHAPYYPANRKPSWWVMIGDQKMNRVIVPPIRVTDVPYANPSKAPKDYRMYKLQFQAPPQVGVYTFQLAFVSDTFVGEDVRMFLPLKVEELTSDDEQDQEDEISEPDEDTLAGQMAAMRGEKVKKSPYHGDGSDDESSTDDDQSSGSSGSSSDSDSDSD